MPRVSVFIPSYNHAPYVAAAIESVLDQTFQDFEIVVTDDGSSDGTPDIVAALEDPRIHLNRFAVNRGAAVAVNDALRRCRGDYLALLNSDDRFVAHKLERQVAFLDANPDVGAVFAWPSFIDHAGQAIPPEQALNGHLFDVENRSQAEWLHYFFFSGNCLCHPTILIRRECYDKVGTYDARFAALPDFQMWIRLVSVYKIHVLPERLIEFRHLPNAGNASSTRTDNFLRYQWENPKALRLYADLPQALFESVFARGLAMLGLDPQQDRRMVLGRLCLKTDNPTLHRLALDLFYEALPPDGNDKLGAFRHAEFHRQASGAKDVHNIVALQRITSLEAELRNAKDVVARAPALTGTPTAAARTPDDRSMAILDDIFPQVISAFRFEEYRSYLDRFPNARVYTTGTAFHFANETRSVTDVIAEYESLYPMHKGRVTPLARHAFPSASLYYMIFLNNIAEHVANIERQGAPFVFTLYPGGGLALGQAESDAKLKRVLTSPSFSRVIATQPIIQAYLLQNDYCRGDQVIPIFGGILPRSAFDAPPSKARFPNEKSSIDICFVANRYMPHGNDKGYDVFVHFAQILADAKVPVRFHVVGSFDANVLPLGAAASRFEFHGLQPTSFFRKFYARMDAIMSPNRPFVLAPGAFDGFPTGCCIEAGLQAVAVFCTDELGQNIGLRDGTDFCLIRPDANDLVAKFADVLAQPDGLAAMGQNGRVRMMDLYGAQRQTQPRIDLLQSVMDQIAARAEPTLLRA